MTAHVSPAARAMILDAARQLGLGPQMDAGNTYPDIVKDGITVSCYGGDFISATRRNSGRGLTIDLLKAPDKAGLLSFSYYWGRHLTKWEAKTLAEGLAAWPSKRYGANKAALEALLAEHGTPVKA